MSTKKNNDLDQGGDLVLEKKTKTKSKKPRRYNVLIHNDDYTTMEFVVQILETIFRKSPAEATAIMLKIHSAGRGVAGTFSREIAETKVEQVHARAQQKGCPLRASYEPVS